MLRLRNLSIMARLRLVVLFSGIGLAIAIGVGLLNLSGTMHDDIALKTRSQVETAVSVIDHYYAESQAGRMTEAEAKAAAIGAVKAMRYGGQEYFWITTLETKMVMHPMKPALDGKDVSANRDPKGKALFSEMTKVAKANGRGFVNYMWPKPGHDQPQPKISYVALMPAWGWIVGSGVYVDDIDTAIGKEALEQVAIGLVLVLIVGVGAALLGRTITRPIMTLTQRMSGLAEGDKDSPVPFADLANETGEMARALAVFRQAALDRDRLEAETAAMRDQATAEAQKRAEAERAAAEVQRRVVSDVTAVAARLAEGDLTVRLARDFPADYTELRENLNAALAQLASAMKAVRDNLVDVGFVGTLWEGSTMPLQNVTYFTPFSGGDHGLVARAFEHMNTTIPAIADNWSKLNIVPVSSFITDSYHLWTNFPIKSLDDLRNRKINAPGTSANWLTGTGATPVDGALTTYYTDIQTGVSEGALSFFVGILPTRVYEVAKYITKVDLGAMYVGGIGVNKERMEKFPKPVQDAIRAAGKASTAAHTKDVASRIASSEAEMVSKGAIVSTLPTADRERWIKGLPNIAKIWADSSGPASRGVLKAYFATLRDSGASPPRAWDNEA
ncbi:TRAP transporter substrate-binding protein DctP [uncultured Caulobacter sp.]|uniref:TRAP transporter substrate-binding protein DctP n=1 Tax=uncultured Caulobacter sp. TaxID=158749 RepID=UPI0026179EA6|nr:TRAP transporter substrate-binding protein DctP [uncultured Caulobacter sp.]